MDISTSTMGRSFTLRRNTLPGARAKRLYRGHDVVDAATLPLMLLHCRGMGHGYLMLLSGVFWGNSLLGLLAPGSVSWLGRYTTPWTVSHIACSVPLTVLSIYHAWTALLFE